MSFPHAVPVAVCLLAMSGAVAAETSVRADGHAPIGVMGDHTHAAGEWMFSYRYMRMEMGGQRVQLAAGVNWAIPGESVTNRLALEVIVPVYEDLDGPQMSEEYSVVVGW